MADMFSGSEIVEIAIQIEKNGKDYYDTLVEQSRDERSVELFRYLSVEEEKHIAAFEKILETVEKYNPAESFPNEYFAYMNALASTHVFTQKDKGREVALKLKDTNQALDMAIGFEKDSILFYQAMKNIVPETENSLVDQLIIQEQEHLQKLTDLKKDYI